MNSLVLALLVGLAGAAQPANLTGTVVDSLSAAVPNATVRLEVSGRTIDEVMTASDGRLR